MCSMIEVDWQHQLSVDQHGDRAQRPEISAPRASDEQSRRDVELVEAINAFSQNEANGDDAGPSACPNVCAIVENASRRAQRWLTMAAMDLHEGFRDPALAEADELTGFLEAVDRMPGTQAIQRALREALDPAPGMRLLDAGCGNGLETQRRPRCMRACRSRPGPQRRAARPGAPRACSRTSVDRGQPDGDRGRSTARPDPHRARPDVPPSPEFERALDDLIALLRRRRAAGALRARLRRDDPRAPEHAGHASSRAPSMALSAGPPRAVGPRTAASPPAERGAASATSPPRRSRSASPSPGLAQDRVPDARWQLDAGMWGAWLDEQKSSSRARRVRRGVHRRGARTRDEVGFHAVRRTLTLRPSRTRVTSPSRCPARGGAVARHARHAVRRSASSPPSSAARGA